MNIKNFKDPLPDHIQNIPLDINLDMLYCLKYPLEDIIEDLWVALEDKIYRELKEL